jgi:hypothetical protein
MRLLKTLLAEGSSVFLRMFAMIVYSAWAIKLGVIDTDTHPIFALAMVLLSIYGLWVLVRRASEHLIRWGETASELP